MAGAAPVCCMAVTLPSPPARILSMRAVHDPAGVVSNPRLLHPPATCRSDVKPPRENASVPVRTGSPLCRPGFSAGRAGPSEVKEGVLMNGHWGPRPCAESVALEADLVAL